MAASPRVWINGKFYDKADAKISVYDHGLLYGDGVFEGIRIYSGKVVRHREPIDRLYAKGEVAECTGDNVFVVKKGVLRTPPTDAGILEGVTRNVVMELAEAAGIPLRVEALTRHDVFAADEFFLTGTAAEIIPVVKCDGRPIGTGKPGPVFRQLRERLQQLIRQ